MRILIISDNQINRYNWSHELFRQEFKNHHDTIYYGEGFNNYIPNKPINEVIKDNNWNFDLILTYGLKYTEKYLGIGEINNIPKAHIVVDYFPNATSGLYERNHNLFNRDKYDIYFGVVGNIVKNLKINGFNKSFLLPFSIDTNLYKRTKEFNQKTIDVFSVFTVRDDTYPNRKYVRKMVNRLNDLKVFINRVQHEDYIDKINDSKICITSNNKFKSLSIKYYEIMSCGSMLLADRPEDLEELGFIPNKHLVIYEDINDLREKIYYYLSHGKELRYISNQGMDFVRENHSNSIRVKQFTEIIKREFDVNG